MEICAYILDSFLKSLNIYIYIYIVHRYICIYKQLFFLVYMTRQLSKYLKVHSTSGTHMMSNDDHLLVPILDILPAFRYAKGNVTFVSNVACVGFQFLA